MTTEQIIILVLGIVIAALVAALIVLLIKYKGAKRAADGSAPWQAVSSVAVHGCKV